MTSVSNLAAAEEKASKSGLALKLSQVMGAAGKVSKGGYNKNLNYHYALEADVSEAIRHELVKRKVAFVPEIKGMEVHEIELGREKAKGRITCVKMRMLFVDAETGEEIGKEWYGTGYDNIDKGLAKAITAATKTFLLKTFLLPTHDDPEQAHDGELHDIPPGPETHSAMKSRLAKSAREALSARQAPQAATAPPRAAAPSDAPIAGAHRIVSVSQPRTAGNSRVVDVVDHDGVVYALWEDTGLWSDAIAARDGHEDVIFETKPGKPKMRAGKPTGETWPDVITDLVRRSAEEQPTLPAEGIADPHPPHNMNEPPPPDEDEIPF